MNRLLPQLENPPAAWRPVPFWSWNDRLDPQVLAWQIDEMQKAGLGGYFMHARGGIQTEYLSEDWMNCIRTGIEEAEKRGMEAWIYDESGWPSGYADGKVTEANPLFSAHWITLEDRDTASPRAVVHTSPYYIDVLSPDAVALFLKFTHEAYLERFGDAFGGAMKGFFTDEPRIFWNNEGDLPWSPILPEEFRKAYGYELEPVLPLLFLDRPGSTAVRFDFWKLVSRLFVDSFIRQIGDWCEAHNCQLTGHVMMEESVFSQLTGTGGAMPCYEFMQAPGVDWLRRTVGNPVIPHQVGSAAAQTGRRQVLTESYALCGWHVSFEELKWIAEWQYVHGVNRMCQHLEGYSLRGLRKRDYPPSLFYQQPWWSEYRRFNDWIARLGMLLADGQAPDGVLLLHPMHSGWVRFDGTKNEAVVAIDDAFAAASEALADTCADWHYGDEVLLDHLGSVSDTPEGPRLVVGACRYHTVVLPAMVSMDRSTLALLARFQSLGGRVFAFGALPTLCDGRPDPALDAFTATLPRLDGDADALAAVLAPHQAFTVHSDAAPNTLRSFRRVQPDGEVVFLVHHGRERACSAELRFPDTVRVTRYRPEDNTLVPLEAVPTAEGLALSLSLAPMGSAVLWVERNMLPISPSNAPCAAATVSPTDAPCAATSVSPTAAPCGTSVPTRLVPGDTWTITTCDPNTLTLDACAWSVDDGPWQPELPVIHVMDRLLALRRPCEIALRFSFRSELSAAECGVLQLVVERIGDFAITVNGRPAPAPEAGWWKDLSFGRTDIGPLLVRGRNEIVLRRTFFQSEKVYHVLFDPDVYESERNKLTFDTELESIYLTGDFGVYSESPWMEEARGGLFTTGPFALRKRPTEVFSGDLTRQGFAFFAGNLRLTQTVMMPDGDAAAKPQLLCLGTPAAPMLDVSVNGDLPTPLLWAPWTVDLTGRLHPGENRLSVTVWGSNRNLFGPHHHRKGELFQVGPESFTGRWSWVEREAEGQVATAAEMADNYWRDGWSMVRFGLARKENGQGV